ncbi:MAG: DNRLRE domain-containing protein [Planctomycetota bacterium]
MRSPALPRRLLLAALASVPLAAQTTVAIPCGADNTLYQSAAGDLSNGAGTGIFVGVNATGLVRRGLVRFDVAASLPSGARILAARLELNVASASSATAEPMTGHRLLQPWGEGTSVATGSGGSGAPATPGDATWLHRYWNTTTWNSAGGDFATVPSFVAAMPQAGAFSSLLSRQAAADVQSWLDAPGSNFGWLLRSSEIGLQSARRLDSRESTGLRPSLVVAYLLPGQNGTWGLGCPTQVGNPTVGFLGTPVGGSSIQLAKSNFPWCVAIEFFALAIDPLGVPVLPPGWVGCSAHLPEAEWIIGNSSVINGSATSAFAVPLGFPGYLVACQVVLMPQGPIGYLASNVALTVLQ